MRQWTRPVVMLAMCAVAVSSTACSNQSPSAQADETTAPPVVTTETVTATVTTTVTTTQTMEPSPPEASSVTASTDATGSGTTPSGSTPSGSTPPEVGCEIVSAQQVTKVTGAKAAPVRAKRSLVGESVNGGGVVQEQCSFRTTANEVALNVQKVDGSAEDLLRKQISDLDSGDQKNIARFDVGLDATSLGTVVNLDSRLMARVDLAKDSKIVVITMTGDKEETVKKMASDLATVVYPRM